MLTHPAGDGMQETRRRQNATGRIGKITMPFATNKGVRLHWDESGTGTPVVLVMGHWYSSALWYPVRDALAAEHRVIWYDNRGTGETDASTGFSLEDMVQDTLTVMDAAGIEKAHIFGVSMGGGIVLDLGLHFPERALSVILGCTMILTPDKPRVPAWVRLAYFLPRWILTGLLKTKVANQGYGSAAAPEAIARDLAVLAAEKTDIRSIHAQAGAIAGYSLTLEEAATLSIPALVMHGDEDGTVPYAGGVELARTLGVEPVTLKGAGHNYLVAATKKSLACVKAFIDAVDARNPAEPI
jgi:3-oxoadipate enol-lactonase